MYTIVSSFKKSIVRHVSKKLLLMSGLALLTVSNPGSALASGNDWMTSIDGSVQLSQMTIPGTHDSGARYEPVAGTAKCQDLTIAE